MENCLRSFVFLISILWAAGPAAAAAEEQPEQQATGQNEWRLPEVTFPPDNPYTDAKAYLGKQLFFDPRLSGYGSLSCASCHNPGLNWCDGLPSSQSMGHFALGRHTPSILNVAYYTSFFWDGRASTLEEQVKQHLLSPGVMHGGTAEDITGRINRLTDYRLVFKQIFGQSGVTLDNIAAAIATFERTIVSPESPFDRWQAGDEDAIPKAAKRGFALFVGKARCVRCHNGPAFTDSDFHNTGLNSIDPGRYEVSNRDEDRNSFKTPGLRQVAQTAPYMHDGSKATLMGVINFYNRGGDRPGEANELKPLGLTIQERNDLIAFLMSLTSDLPAITIPKLPQP